MSVKSSVEFFEIIEKSKLLSSDQLAAARRLSESETDPKSMARRMIRDGFLNKWQAMHLLSGRSALMLGKYKLLDQSDSGSGPRVLLAKDPEGERLVALVMLGGSRASRSPETVAQQIENASKLIDLKHKSIQPTLAVESEGNRCFLVVPPPTGQPLRKLLQEQGPLPAERVVDYMSRIGEALSYAADHGVTHGDLRLENLQVDEQGVLRVMHLGVAGLVGSIEGKDGAGESGSDAHRADLAGLANVLFGLLTGKPSKTPPGVTSLLEERPDVPKPLIKCFDRLTSSDPNTRYGSMSDLVEDLRAVARPKPPPVPEAKSRIAKQQQAQKASQFVAEPVAEPLEALPMPLPEIQADEAQDEPGSTSPVPAAGPHKEIAVVKDAEASGRTSPAKAAGSPEKIVVTGAAKASGVQPAGAEGLKIKTPKRRAGDSSGLRRPASRRKAGRSKTIDKKVYVIGGAALAGLVLLAAVVWFAMNLISRDDPTQVARTDGDPTMAADPDSSDPVDPSASSEESDPEPNVLSRGLPEESDPELPITTAVPTPVAEPPEPSEPDTQADSQEVSSPDSPDDSATAERSETDAGAAVSATEADESSETDEPLAMADDEPGDSEPEDAPEPASVDEQESEAAVAEETPSAPVMPDMAPFADLASHVDLPAVDSPGALEPTMLGVVHTIRTRQGQCYIRMRGGEHALRGNRVFSMRNSDRGTADWDWDINLRDGSEGTEIKIAHLTLNDEFELQFRWMPAAQNDSAAAHLMNCVLAMTCRGQTHTLALRQPVQATGLDVNLKEAVNRHAIKLANAPDPDRIRLEIKDVRGSGFAVEPHRVLPVERSEAWIKLDEGGGMLSLRLEVDMRRDLQLTFTPHAQWNADARPERINVRQLPQLGNQQMAAVNQWAAMVQKYQAFMKSKASEQEKKQAAQHLRNFENELKLAQEGLSRFEQFEQTLEQARLEIIFRVFFDADGSETDLLLAGS